MGASRALWWQVSVRSGRLRGPGVVPSGAAPRLRSGIGPNGGAIADTQRIVLLAPERSQLSDGRDVPLGVVAHRRLATGYQREACAVDVEVRVPPSSTRISAGADLDQGIPRRAETSFATVRARRQSDTRHSANVTSETCTVSHDTATPLGTVVRSGDRSAGRALS